MLKFIEKTVPKTLEQKRKTYVRDRNYEKREGWKSLVLRDGRSTQACIQSRGSIPMGKCRYSKSLLSKDTLDFPIPSTGFPRTIFLAI